MGDQNTKPRRINGVEGAAGQGMVCGGPGVNEKFGGKLEWTAGKILQGAGVGSDPTEIDVPNSMPDDFADLSDAQKKFIMVYGI